MSKQGKKKVKEKMPEKLYVRQEECVYEFDEIENAYTASPKAEDFAKVGQTVRVGVYSLVGYEDIYTNVVVE